MWWRRTTATISDSTGWFSTTIPNLKPSKSKEISSISVPKLPRRPPRTTIPSELSAYNSLQKYLESIHWGMFLWSMATPAKRRGWFLLTKRSSLPKNNILKNMFLIKLEEWMPKKQPTSSTRLSTKMLWMPNPNKPITKDFTQMIMKMSWLSKGYKTK